VTGLSDWELWACARQQIEQHGNDGAVFSSATRADELLATGDMAGHAAWVAILLRIRQLTGALEGEIRH
jgi:hypothetical protein